MSDSTNIKDYYESIKPPPDSSRKVSLYRLMRTRCPHTIRKLDRKVSGDKASADKSGKNWYVSVLNYLVTKKVFTTEEIDKLKYHVVAENFRKYFPNERSQAYSEKNQPEHVMLYKETAEAFLKKTGLLTESGHELFDEERNKAPELGKDILDINPKARKAIRIVCGFILLWSIFQYFALIPKMGFADARDIFLNSLLFGFSLLMIVS